MSNAKLCMYCSLPAGPYSCCIVLCRDHVYAPMLSARFGKLLRHALLSFCLILFFPESIRGSRSALFVLCAGFGCAPFPSFPSSLFLLAGVLLCTLIYGLFPMNQTIKPNTVTVTHSCLFVMKVTGVVRIESFTLVVFPRSPEKKEVYTFCINVLFLYRIYP